MAVLGIGRDIAEAPGNPALIAWALVSMMVCWLQTWCLRHQTEICLENEKIDAKIGDNIVYSGGLSSERNSQVSVLKIILVLTMLK